MLWFFARHEAHLHYEIRKQQDGDDYEPSDGGAQGYKRHYGDKAVYRGVYRSAYHEGYQAGYRALDRAL